LPAGHPFTNVLSAFYWSASTLAEAPTLVWAVSFDDGHVSAGGSSGAFFVWCVRGGGVLDNY
jgi:hypothetical protein